MFTGTEILSSPVVAALEAWRLLPLFSNVLLAVEVLCSPYCSVLHLYLALSVHPWAVSPHMKRSHLLGPSSTSWRTNKSQLDPPQLQSLSCKRRTTSWRAQTEDLCPFPSLTAVFAGVLQVYDPSCCSVILSTGGHSCTLRRSYQLKCPCLGSTVSPVVTEIFQEWFRVGWRLRKYFAGTSSALCLVLFLNS